MGKHLKEIHCRNHQWQERPSKQSVVTNNTNPQTNIKISRKMCMYTRSVCVCVCNFQCIIFLKTIYWQSSQRLPYIYMYIPYHIGSTVGKGAEGVGVRSHMGVSQAQKPHVLHHFLQAEPERSFSRQPA